MIDTNITNKDYDIIYKAIDDIMNWNGTYFPRAMEMDLLATNIEQTLKDMVETGSWPFGYTRGEVIERLVWFHTTEGSGMARDPNVFDAATFAIETAGQAPWEPEINRPRTRSENVQAWIIDVMDVPTTPKQAQAQEQIKALITAPTSATAYDTFLQLLENSKEYLALPYDKLKDYVYRFQNWINRSQNIRDALWKMAVGVISEKDFHDSIQTYKESEDYRLGFYEEDIV